MTSKLTTLPMLAIIFSGKAKALKTKYFGALTKTGPVAMPLYKVYVYYTVINYLNAPVPSISPPLRSEKKKLNKLNFTI